MNNASDTADGILQKLAYQKGVLTLLKGVEPLSPLIEKALRDIDELIEQVR